MFRAFGIGSTATVILLSFAICSAQDEGRAPDVYWDGGAGLIGYQQVKDELKLADEQMGTIKIAAREHRKEIRDKLQDPEFPLKERAKTLEEYWARMRSFRPDEFLTAEQSARFRQIQLWVLGPKAFNEQGVADALKLPQSQRDALKTIEGEFSNTILEFTRDNRKFGTSRRGVEREQVEKERKQFVEMITDKEKECRAALTDEQNAQFDKMRGPKFEANVRAVLGAHLSTLSP